MRQLRLSTAKLPKHLADAHGLETTAENSVERLAASRDFHDTLPQLTELLRGLEATAGRLLVVSKAARTRL
jgi:hypothetical protein